MSDIAYRGYLIRTSLSASYTSTPYWIEKDGHRIVWVDSIAGAKTIIDDLSR